MTEASPNQACRLELDRDPEFHRKQWLIERVGLRAWALLIVAGLLGLLGAGPLSNASVSSPSGELTISHQRIAHYHKPVTIQLLVKLEEGSTGPIPLTISQSFLDAVQIERVEPQPQRQQVAVDGAFLYFDRRPGSQQAKIVIHLEYEQYGPVQGSIGIDGQEPARLDIFVFP